MKDSSSASQGVFAGLEELQTGDAGAHKLALMLESSPLFRGFSHGDLSRIAAFLHAYRVRQETILYRANEYTDYLAIVVQGSLRACAEGKRDGARHCATISQGETCGEAAFVSHRAQPATVTAAAATIIATLDSGALTRLREQWPRLGVRLVRAIAEQLTRNLPRGAAPA